ncbi:MAG TPA: acetate--CoA ligase family protein [Deltaproteobacteria bacterium]|nr:acetate--CoA ligase family protein [Deltaproteobacteria bacterium]HOI06484.1 acetate--CoA ligase family protein [Deltaproteobacteria bacterium]
MSNPLQTIMSPASIAITGASSNFRKMGTIQMMNLVHSGYTGEIMPIHPREKEIMGLKVYASIPELPHAPDLAILVVPTHLVPGMLEDFGMIGTRHAVVITAGFKETGRDGHALEEEILAIARRHGIRFLGPNCLGIVNTHLPLNITVGPILTYGGRLSIASQSGTYIAQTVGYLQRHGIAFGKAISVGNEADIDIADCIEYLGEDEETRAIGLYIEGIRNASKFLDVTRRVSAKKPIVAQYVGGTEAGARSGSSHTGAMAGPDFIYDGLFAQAGIVRVDTIEEVYKFGWALASQPPLKGRRIAVLTNSGGPGSGIATTLDALGLEVPEFSPEIQEKVCAFLPGHASARNPVDLTFHMGMENMAKNIPEVLFEAPDIDGVIIHGIMDTGFMEIMYPYVEKMIPVSKEDFLKANETPYLDSLLKMPFDTGKPLMISSFFGREDHCVRVFQDHGIPCLDSPEKAARAMGVLYRYSRIRARGEAPNVQRAPAPLAAQRIMDTQQGPVIDEFTAKEVLRAYGIPTPGEVLAKSLEEAKAAARDIGWPVAVKACSAAIAHKTEAGLVFLDVRDDEGLEKACQAILDAGGDILVARMVSGRRELMAGVSTYPGFPPCVMFGLGGIFAEALHDFTIRLAPLCMDDALDMIGSIKAADVLGAYRGMEEVDREALAAILVRLGDLALDFPCIKEIDLNPIIIAGGKPAAADALMIVRR